MRLILFTGPDCHLCQLAIDELAALTNPNLSIATKNIRDNADLYHLYAMRIPVLKREDTLAELNWPFSQHDIKDFIQ